MTVRLLKKAQADLLEIDAWIRAEDPLAADKVMEDILSGIEQLEKLPALGPVARDGRLAAKGIGCLTRGSFVVFYKQVGRQERVLRVLRGRQHWRNVL
jgi:plasmid stabilization system protein ParE